MVIVLGGTKHRGDSDPEAYKVTAQRMRELVRQNPGFISAKTFVAEDGEKLLVFRFESEEALDAWHNHPEHVEVQKYGREHIYESYWVQVCKVIREYKFQRDEGRVEVPRS